MSRAFQFKSKYEDPSEVMALAEQIEGIESRFRKVMYQGKEYFVIRSNYNGTFDLAERLNISYGQLNSYWGGLNAVEGSELEDIL